MRKLIMLTSCNGLLLCSGWGSPAFYYVYNPSTNLLKRLSQLDNSHDVSILHATAVLRMAFDPTKSRDNKVPNGLHQGSNFLQSFGGREGSYDLMFIQTDIHAILYLQRRLFESRECLLLVSRDDIDSKEFTIYVMVKGYPVWTVRYVVSTDEFMTPLLDRWSICSAVWSIGLGEREDDSFLVINISGKIIKYNIISKTISQIFDIGSNQMDDEYEFFPAYKVDHYTYKFIPSFASV
nr:hypothetical protein [Tanacetum cinerariifolium]